MKATRRRRTVESVQVTVQKALRKSVDLGFRRGQVGAALVEGAFNLVDAWDDEDRRLVVEALELRLRILRDGYRGPEDLAAIASERAKLVWLDGEPGRGWVLTAKTAVDEVTEAEAEADAVSPIALAHALLDGSASVARSDLTPAQRQKLANRMHFAAKRVTLGRNLSIRNNI